MLFVTSAKNNYELIENAILKDEFDVDNLPSDIKDIYFSENSIDAAFAVPGYESEFTREDFEKIVVKGAAFVIGIILARILSPSDYGLIGMLTIFITLSPFRTFLSGSICHSSSASKIISSWSSHCGSVGYEPERYP